MLTIVIVDWACNALLIPLLLNIGDNMFQRGNARARTEKFRRELLQDNSKLHWFDLESSFHCLLPRRVDIPQLTFCKCDSNIFALVSSLHYIVLVKCKAPRSQCHRHLVTGGMRRTVTKKVTECAVREPKTRLSISRKDIIFMAIWKNS